MCYGVSVSVAALRGKATNLAVGSKEIPQSHATHNKPHTEIHWERHERAAASAQERSSWEPSGRQVSWGEGFSRVGTGEIGRICSERIGGFSCLGIGGLDL